MVSMVIARPESAPAPPLLMEALVMTRPVSVPAGLPVGLPASVGTVPSAGPAPDSTVVVLALPWATGADAGTGGGGSTV